MARIDIEIASLRAGQRRLFAETERLRREMGDLHEALGARDRALERLELKLQRVNVELSLERLRREGELPPAPKHELDLV